MCEALLRHSATGNVSGSDAEPIYRSNQCNRPRPTERRRLALRQIQAASGQEDREELERSVDKIESIVSDIGGGIGNIGDAFRDAAAWVGDLFD
jgi:hypothetical protein